MHHAGLHLPRVSGSASDSPHLLLFQVDSRPAKEPPGRSLLGSLRGGTKPAPLGSASRKGCGGKQRESTAPSISRAPWVLECRARRRRRCFLLVAARSRRSERSRNPSRNVRGCSATMLTRGGDGNCGLEDWEIRAEPNGIDKISKSCGERLASRRFYECAPRSKFGDGFVWRPSQGLGETRTERGTEADFSSSRTKISPSTKSLMTMQACFRWWADYFAVRYPKRLPSTVAVPDCVFPLGTAANEFPRRTHGTPRL